MTHVWAVLFAALAVAFALIVDSYIGVSTFLAKKAA